jgi:septum formation protein
MKIVLASNSPRRRSILQNIGLEIDVRAQDICEDIEEKNPFKYAKDLSYLKACAAKKNIDEMIIAADTIVVLNNEILGKPKDKNEAVLYLKRLSSGWHQVATAVTILYKDIVLTDIEITKVKFSDLSKREIDNYILCNEWTDKAGGYGIQGVASFFVEKIEGCYFNVVGFPVRLFYSMLKKSEIDVWGELKCLKQQSQLQ